MVLSLVRSKLKTYLKMKNILFIVTCLILGFSCKSKKIVGNGEGQKIKSEKITMKAKIGEIPEKSDAISIEKVVINGNEMVLEVSYSGGCKDHTFELIGSQMIAKSLPPIRAVKLIHHANEDNCRAMIMKTLVFDISDLAYQQKDGDEIFLTINDERYKYVYKK